jgi:hypothetical protein
MSSSFGRDSRGIDSKAKPDRSRRGSPFAWRRTLAQLDGRHTIEDAPQYAREYFSVEESNQSSTYRELLGVYACLQAMTHMCAGKLVLFHVDAQKLSGCGEPWQPAVAPQRART